jgi:8-oxo-dGTP pyrophosphatase MutT (NUDIX family)
MRKAVGGRRGGPLLAWDDAKVEQLSTRIVYNDPWMTVRQDQIRRSDGSIGTYAVVEKPDFALVLPRDRDGFWLVQQYRYPVGLRAWEFPQGSWGHGASGSQEDLARTELAEETGLRARAVTHLGRLHEAYGFCSQAFDVFLAEDLEQGAPNREATEQDMVHVWFCDDDLSALIRRGEVTDSPSLAALTLYYLRGLHGSGLCPVAPEAK